MNDSTTVPENLTTPVENRFGVWANPTLERWVSEYAEEHGIWLALAEWENHLNDLEAKYRRVADDENLTSPSHREQYFASMTDMYVTPQRPSLAEARRCQSLIDAGVAAGDLPPVTPGGYADHVERYGQEGAIARLEQAIENYRLVAQHKEDFGNPHSASYYRLQADQLEAFVVQEKGRAEVAEREQCDQMAAIRAMWEAERPAREAAAAARAAEQRQAAEQRAAEAAEQRRLKRAGMVALESGSWWDHFTWLHQQFGDRSFSVREACEHGYDDPDWAGPPGLRLDLTTPDAARQLGMAYQQVARRAFDGAWIEPGTVSRGVRRWRVTVKTDPE